MDSKQNPFSLYDFLGYFTPGAIFLYISAAVSNRFFKFEFHKSLSERGFTDLETYVGLVLLAYVIGHALSFLSSAIVEKFSIWTHGYPSKYLTGTLSPGYLQTIGINGESLPIPCHAKLIRIIVWIIMFPVAMQDLVVGRGLSARSIYVKSLDRGTTEIIRMKIIALLKDKYGMGTLPKHLKPQNNDFFRLSYHYVLTKSLNHITSLKNYVALYGFTRTMTFLSIILFWSTLAFLIFNESKSNILNGMLMLSVPFSFIYYMAFNKFVRRFTLEVLMALVVTYDDTSQKLNTEV
jgi:hypothetical protein